MEYTSLNDYLKNEYGYKLYKLSLNAGLTCPNRDGKAGWGGCTFCSEGGSGDFAEDAGLSISDQIEAGKIFLQSKFRPERGPCYIAYFQAFTSTYGPAEYLERIFMEAAEHPDIAIVSVATRPDCLGDEVLRVLEKVRKIKPVWMELGLQTIRDDIADEINRCYPTAVYDEAVKRLNAMGIKVITHIILGLPGESEEDMLSSVRHAVAMKSWGIKLQLLHVLKGTALAKKYADEPFHIFTLEEYTALIVRCLRIIPRECVVHRITGDGPKKILIAPLWSGDKKRVLNALNKAIREG